MLRADAFEELNQYIKNPNLIKHSLACEAIMKALCLHFNPSADEVTINKWGTTGLLHDLDYELTKDTPEKHALVTQEKVGDKLDQDVMYAIKAHNYNYNKVEPHTLMDWSIYCCDELSGLIIAATLIHPDRKLASVDVNFIMNRFNDPGFAKGANRDQIKMCTTKLNIPLGDFIEISLKAMQSISTELNL
ncbi:phosphohydrolase [Candidatus Dojkabacteria bacterium]|uniref:Phosphohydrolase n=1 Tax=Candidatus Dojkabacteria bacterium TaxID=2099670 RepID=A0A5C7J7I1_9BACT|nr:MAG: phosphohydrolase [Candidatus Dojkabacteria bacterium]